VGTTREIINFLGGGDCHFIANYRILNLVGQKKEKKESI
jgi:hypothetical protein